MKPFYAADLHHTSPVQMAKALAMMQAHITLSWERYLDGLDRIGRSKDAGLAQSVYEMALAHYSSPDALPTETEELTIVEPAGSGHSHKSRLNDL